MNREIKFRAWDLTRKTMLADVQEYKQIIFTMHSNVPDCITFGNICNSKTEVVMQASGLVDKNGWEIFEGDILQSTHQYDRVRFYKVFHKPGGLCVNDFQDDFKRSPDEIAFYGALADPQNASFLSSCEIIGNVFENPELI